MTLKKNGYLPRYIDEVVDRHLRAFGAVEITGTMWSGKTWTAMAHGSSRVSFDNDQARALAELDVQAVLDGDRPHIIDEWQEVPAVWDAVRNKVDDAAGERGLFILTGSSRPARGKTHHTGSGRISRVRMWPMSLAELGLSTGRISLARLFDGEFESGSTSTDLLDIARWICRGGWPAARDLYDSAALLVPDQYLEALLAKDDDKAPASERSLRSCLRSLARNIGSAAKLQTIAADMGLPVDVEHRDASERNVSAIIGYLENRYVLCDLTGWDAPIKSPQRLRVKPKRCFADPSLAASLLGAAPERLLGNLQLMGQLFEELCLRDLRVYVEAMPEAGPDALHYYRDSDGLEVDAIIELRDGRWGAIEIKLGANKAADAEGNLLRLKRKIANNPAARNPEPSFMLVLVGKTDFMYRLPSGVLVAPINALC